jgi:NAD(P)-dependent dehydrogenase (short-subunit alcohol dehydrogenase family)
VIAVCPGAIDTSFRKQLGQTYEEELETGHRYPIGRIGMAKEVAKTVVWLCSDEASLITGSAIVVDGGLTAQKII